MPVSQALREMAVPDLDEFDPAFVAEESAALMFEAMEYRAFAAARRAYAAAKPEDLDKLVREDALVALVHELTYEAGIEKVKARKRRAQERAVTP